VSASLDYRYNEEKVDDAWPRRTSIWYPQDSRKSIRNDEIEWTDGLKIVRMEDGRVKIGRQGGGWRIYIATSPFYAAAGSNPTTHAIVGFECVATE